jgi:hypothetical protein
MIAWSVGRVIPSVFGQHALQSRLIAGFDRPAGLLWKFHLIMAPLPIQSSACPIRVADHKWSFTSPMLLSADPTTGNPSPLFNTGQFI